MSDHPNAPEAVDGATVWIAIRGLRDGELLGVFKSEAEAVAVCAVGEDFVGPAVIGVDVSAHRGPWPGAYRPSCEDRDMHRCGGGK